jgi:hypothetical protein
LAVSARQASSVAYFQTAQRHTRRHEEMALVERRFLACIQKGDFLAIV